MIDLLQKIIAGLKNVKSGGITSLIKVSGTQVGVTGSTYATGKVLGTKSPIAVEMVRGKNGTGILQSIVVQDLSAQSGAIDIIVFDSNPTATTFTDNTLLTVNDADIPKIIGIISITATNYGTFVDNCVATKAGIGLPIQSVSNTPQIYICPLSRDAKTYVANELSLEFGILQD